MYQIQAENIFNTISAYTNWSVYQIHTGGTNPAWFQFVTFSILEMYQMGTMLDLYHQYFSGIKRTGHVLEVQIQHGSNLLHSVYWKCTKLGDRAGFVPPVLFWYRTYWACTGGTNSAWFQFVTFSILEMYCQNWWYISSTFVLNVPNWDHAGFVPPVHAQYVS